MKGSSAVTKSAFSTLLLMPNKNLSSLTTSASYKMFLRSHDTNAQNVCRFSLHFPNTLGWVTVRERQFSMVFWSTRSPLKDHFTPCTTFPVHCSCWLRQAANLHTLPHGFTKREPIYTQNSPSLRFRS